MKIPRMSRAATPVRVCGLGAATALGETLEATWGELVAGRSGLRRRPGSSAHPVGTIDAGNGASDSAGRMIELLDMSAKDLTADVADKSVFRSVGLVVLGVSYGDLFEAPSKSLDHWVAKALKRLREQAGLPPECEAIIVSSACSSGNDAIALAADLVRAGAYEAVIAGGVDVIDPVKLSGHITLGTQSDRLVSPLDAAAHGTNFAEGAALALIASEARAGSEPASLAGAEIRLEGWSCSADCASLTAPDPGGAGASIMIERSLAMAGLTFDAITYVSLHGSGTPLNDAMEAQALTRALRPWPTVPIASSVKAAIGHALGAAGAIEFALTAKALAARMAPPTFGLETPSALWAESGFCLPRHASLLPVGDAVALNLTFGFGGANSCTLLTAHHPND